jgi:hypothetical protein
VPHSVRPTIRLRVPPTAGCGRVIDRWMLAHRELSPTGTFGAGAVPHRNRRFPQGCSSGKGGEVNHFDLF